MSNYPADYNDTAVAGLLYQYKYIYELGVTTSSSDADWVYVCMYEIRDRQDPVKGSGWVLFPSTMAEQPIQQMVVGHLCFQECAEQ